MIEEHLWVLIAIPVVFFLAGIRTLAEYERGVMFRFGRFRGVKLPGFRWIIPGIDRIVKVSVRQIVMTIPDQEVKTRDGREAMVHADIRFHVHDAARALLGVESYLYATSQHAKDRIREIFRSVSASDLERRMERLESRMKEALNSDTARWGVQIDDVSFNLSQPK